MKGQCTSVSTTCGPTRGRHGVRRPEWMCGGSSRCRHGHEGSRARNFPHFLATVVVLRRDRKRFIADDYDVVERHPTVSQPANTLIRDGKRVELLLGADVLIRLSAVRMLQWAGPHPLEAGRRLWRPSLGRARKRFRLESSDLLIRCVLDPDRPWYYVQTRNRCTRTCAMTEAEFATILGDTSKTIAGDIDWKDDEDHSPAVEFQVNIDSANGWPLLLRGSYNGLAQTLTFAVIHRGAGRIYALDLGKDHRNPTGELVGETHKHTWTERFRDKNAYAPPDITAGPDEPLLVWEQFCKEAIIHHNGTLKRPPPTQGLL